MTDTSPAFDSNNLDSNANSANANGHGDAGPRPVAASWFALRRPTPQWQSMLLGIACVAFVFVLWWIVTRADTPEERIVTPATLPSVSETFGEFRSLWFDRALTRNMLITLRRVVLGFSLAAMIGIPLGVLAGCFTRFAAFLAPLVIFGRNIPLAALTMLTFFIFGIGEQQKVMFILIACVAFIVADVSQAVRDVDQRYVDTAFTLGAGRWQIIRKVLVPLAMPSIFNSLRLLFGLAFGYIMLAELVKIGSEEGGVGYLILVSQRQGPREHIYLIVLIIPLVAFVIDRFLFWVQRELFPHVYGGFGLLNQSIRFVVRTGEDVMHRVLGSTPLSAPMAAAAGLPIPVSVSQLPASVASAEHRIHPE